MPAELLLEGKMTKAADVYGFAMMAWELFTGEQLFKGLRQSQVANHSRSNMRYGHLYRASDAHLDRNALTAHQ